MHWRLRQSEFERNKGAANKRAMRKIVSSGAKPGLLAYDGKLPVAWVAVGPRTDFGRLNRSRTLKAIDDQPVWSVVCMFIAKEYRRQGLSVVLLKEAAKFVRQQGGAIVEGYPMEPKKGAWPDAFVWTGVTQAYLRAGFKETLRRSDSRPIMRLYLER